MVVDTKVSIFKEIPDVLPDVKSIFEPGFEYTRDLIPNNSDKAWCERLASYLDRRIRRFPKDLTVHIQRINALIVAGAQGDRLFAAAIDLNTVLGSNGEGLQRSIYDRISCMLSDQQRADLDEIRAGLNVSGNPALMLCSLPRPNENELRIISSIKND